MGECIVGELGSGADWRLIERGTKQINVTMANSVYGFTLFTPASGETISNYEEIRIRLKPNLSLSGDQSNSNVRFGFFLDHTDRYSIAYTHDGVYTGATGNWTLSCPNYVSANIHKAYYGSGYFTWVSDCFYFSSGSNSGGYPATYTKSSSSTFDVINIGLAGNNTFKLSIAGTIDYEIYAK